MACAPTLQKYTRTPLPPASLLQHTPQEFGHLDVLVNNAAQQTVCDDITKMDPATIERTFRTNVRAVQGVSSCRTVLRMCACVS